MFITAGALAAACAFLAPAVAPAAAAAVPDSQSGPSLGLKRTNNTSGNSSNNTPGASGNQSSGSSSSSQPKPSPSTSAKPTPKPTDSNQTPQHASNNNCPQNSQQPAKGRAQTKPDPCKDPNKGQTSDQKKKKQQDAADQAASIAAAQALLDQATGDLAKATKVYDAAKAKKKRLDAMFAKLGPQVEAAKLNLVRFARQSYMLGVDPNILTQVASLDAGDPTSYQLAQSSLSRIGSVQANQLVASRELVDRIERDKAQTDAEFAAAKATYDLINLNAAVARNTLGLASGQPPSAETTKFFSTYPVSDCSFANQVNALRSCKEAQQWALAQVANPTKNWTGLCLNFVTEAYAAPESIPRAIDQWTGLPPEAQHSPNTVAPPGALMFWAPNHVAISLGNNMLVSTDVLGSGRAWIVSFATIQSRWNLPYLGWTEPDFRNA